MDRLVSTCTPDWLGYSSVERNPLKLGGTPLLKGTRMPAQAVLDNYLDGLSPEEIAQVFELPLSAVRDFLADVVTPALY